MELDERIVEMHGDVKEVKQHLKDLNGAVAQNQEDIAGVRERVWTTRVQVASGLGALAVVGWVVQSGLV